MSIDGEAVRFSLSELRDSAPHVLTSSEVNHPRSAPKYDDKLTGRLQLQIANLPLYMGPIRRTWADGKQQRLEDCIGDFIVGLEEMDQAIVERLNASVKANDHLYFLGGSCMGSQARVLAYRQRIHRKKIFAVPGNHDKQARKLKKEFLWLDSLAELSMQGHAIVLCHYALRVWNRSNRGSWHLYGHSHGHLPEAPDSLSMDVGVDTHNFCPWHYEEIADIMTKKTAVREARSRA